MLIRGTELQDKTILEIGKFTVLWGLFERKYCCNPNDKHNREPLAEMYSRISISDRLKETFSKRLHHRWQITQDDSYTEDGLHPDGANQSSVKQMELMKVFMEAPLGADSNAGCLLIIRRIRNNMMHGLKDVGDLDAQVSLFRAMNDILESIT